MGKFDGILICTDLDGTLLRNDKTISPENKAAIEYFKSEGGYFTFITGRMPSYSASTYLAVNPNAPYGCINGGGLYDGEKGEYVFTVTIDERVIQLIEYIETAFLNVGIQVCVFNKTYFVKENETTVKFRKTTGLPYISADYHDIKEPIAKILFCSEYDSELVSIEKMLREHPLADEFVFVRSAQTLLEILPKGINKGLSIVKLSEYLKIDKNKTIAVGDYNNDIPMFEAAGIGIAVANACQAAFDAADVVTVSTEEHAIAKIIADLESGRIAF